MAGSFYGAVVVLTIAFDLAGSTPEDRRKALLEVGSKAPRGVFAPRMYYDEWTPLGHGDPLKHDPTYDYVPPVLDHVHYWEEPHRKSETSINARKDPPDLDTKPQLHGFPGFPQIPPTMLVPPPLPSIDLASTIRPAPTTVVDVEPINMLLHSSTKGSFFDFKTAKPDTVSSWRVPNTHMQSTTLPTVHYETKDRPFTRNSLYQQSTVVLKPQLMPTKVKLPPSIPIQQGQPFRLPQATKAPTPAKPIKKAEEKESLASLLQSLLDDIPTTTESSLWYTPTTTEPSMRHTSTTPSYIATTTSPTVTTERDLSHFTQPAVPVTAPLYLIIQGHSKVKTYGASKPPSIHDIPYNQLVGDFKTKVRFSRDVDMEET